MAADVIQASQATGKPANAHDEEQATQRLLDQAEAVSNLQPSASRQLLCTLT